MFKTEVFLVYFLVFYNIIDVILLNSARTLATLVWDELHETLVSILGKLVCRHGAKPCNKETELLGTLKASITTT